MVINLTGSNYDLQLPLPKTNFLQRSFSYRGEIAWNQLSNQILEIKDLASFKGAISEDTFYIARAHIYMAWFF